MAAARFLRDPTENMVTWCIKEVVVFLLSQVLATLVLDGCCCSARPECAIDGSTRAQKKWWTRKMSHLGATGAFWRQPKVRYKQY